MIVFVSSSSFVEGNENGGGEDEDDDDDDGDGGVLWLDPILNHLFIFSSDYLLFVCEWRIETIINDITKIF